MLDRAKNTTYGGELSISKYEEKKYDFNIQAGPSYTLSQMSLQPQGNNNAAGFSSSGSLNLYLPSKFGFGTNYEYTYNAQTQSFAAQYKTILNTYIFRTFFKDDALKISLSGNDMLNQNTNFTRGVSANTFTQTNTNGIKRFFMFSVVWNFTKFGTTEQKK